MTADAQDRGGELWTTPGAPVGGEGGSALPLVLVADDDEDSRTIAVLILRHAGYAVAEARTGAEAVELGRALRPALVLMDVSMPELDGWAATRLLKADAATRGVLVLAHTAHASADDAARSVAAGCDGHLPKPVEPRRLVREVARALASGAPNPA
jgi:CheY-like chemotaxis protein